MEKQPLLLLGNCFGRLREFEDNSVDAVITDLPHFTPKEYSGRRYLKPLLQSDSGFGYWLAGFTDGEGCFRIHKHVRGTHTCAFQIKLRRDDRAILDRIKDFIGYGTIRDVSGDGNSKPLSLYQVQNKDGCERVVEVFKRYPLVAKKYLDFEIWAKAVKEWVERPRGNSRVGMADQTQAAIYKAQLRRVREYRDPPWSGHPLQDWFRFEIEESLRVLKPGGSLISLDVANRRHRTACGIEDAGFNLIDSIFWRVNSKTNPNSGYATWAFKPPFPHNRLSGRLELVSNYWVAPSKQGLLNTISQLLTY